MNERRYVSLGPVDRLKAFGEPVPTCDVFGSVEGYQCVVVPLKPEQHGRVLPVSVDLHCVGQSGEEPPGEEIETRGGFEVMRSVPGVRMAQKHPGGLGRIARADALEKRRLDRMKKRIGSLNFAAFGEDIRQRIDTR